MATVTGLTAARMLEIEAASVIDGEVVAGNLILEKFDGSTINAGSVVGPAGPTGPAGPASVSAIPGEVRLWPGGTLPLLATYGKWVWANGAVYVTATYPIAAGHIHTNWRTFNGASDPGAGNFRVPDLRGLVPAGLDQMPGDGARANRMTRSIAITIAGKSGEETHIITLPEMASHDHGGGNHSHGLEQNDGNAGAAFRKILTDIRDTDAADFPANGQYILPSGAIITAQGGNGAHENVQPTVFVPYIVKLD